jgi:hypothetical protein
MGSMTIKELKSYEILKPEGIKTTILLPPKLLFSAIMFGEREL